MKKVALVLFLITFILVSCSSPKLVKVEETQEATSQSGVLISESFSSDDGTWNTGVWPDNAGEDEITDGEYRMTVYDTSYMIWSKTFDFYTNDLSLEVDARLQSGTNDNGQGFICRYRDMDNFYLLHIGNDGWYSIDKYVNNEYENLLSGWAPDGVIDPVANKISALCVGDTLSLTVNDHLLGSVQDGSHPYGEVGLLTRSYDTGNITIAFDNFTVYDASGTN